MFYAEPRSPPGLRPEPLVAYWDEATRRAVLLRQQQEREEQEEQRLAAPEAPASPEVEVVALEEPEGDHQGQGPEVPAPPVGDAAQDQAGGPAEQGLQDPPPQAEGAANDQEEEVVVDGDVTADATPDQHGDQAPEGDQA